MFRKLVALAFLVSGLGAIGSAPVCACDLTPDMPPRVLPLRDVWLSQQRYAELATAWGQYVAAHPQAAIGYVNLFKAQRYANLPQAAQGLELLRKAYAIDPKCAEVLCELSYLEFGSNQRTLQPSMKTVREHSLEAIELRPDWYEPHINLAVFALAAGDSVEAATQLTAAARKGGFPSPLLDYGYNILMSTEPNAIVLTNGDNDTFPALAVQAMYGVRPDVRIVNESLLATGRYAESRLGLSSGRPSPFTQAELDALAESKILPWRSIPAALVDKVAQGTWKQPVYLATSVPVRDEPYKPRLVLEGLVYRVAPGTAVAASSDRLADAPKVDSLISTVFRMQSACDFGYPWSVESSAASIMVNYVGIWYRVAEKYAAVGNLEGVRRMLHEAIRFLRFHAELRQRDGGDYVAKLLDYWKSIDPGNAEVEALARELTR